MGSDRWGLMGPHPLGIPLTATHLILTLIVGDERRPSAHLMLQPAASYRAKMDSYGTYTRLKSVHSRGLLTGAR